MSLTHGEQRTLAAIENQLRRSDPRLAAMLSRFTVKVLPGQRLARTLPSWRRSRRSRTMTLTLIAVVASVLIACAAMGAILASHASPPHGGHTPGAGTAPVQRLGPF